MFVKIQKNPTLAHKFDATTHGDEMARKCVNTHEKESEKHIYGDLSLLVSTTCFFYGGCLSRNSHQVL